jgi:hypothetical protein
MTLRASSWFFLFRFCGFLLAVLAKLETYPAVVKDAGIFEQANNFF